MTVDPEAETRSSSETSFLQSTILSSPSAQIYQRTLANKIIFNDNKTATGVAVSTNGVPYTLSAKKEVILAAGVVGTLKTGATRDQRLLNSTTEV